jgi:DNA-binding NtrC family response regulator
MVRVLQIAGGSIPCGVQLHDDPAVKRKHVCYTAQVMQTATTSSNPTNPTNPTILVVDDDPAVTQLVSLYATEAGFGATVGAGSAREGLAALHKGGFKLVLLDLGLPDRSQDNALGEFLAAADGTPVAVVTGDGRVSTAVRCMREGAFDFIDKPVSPARLLSLLSHASEHARLRALLEPQQSARFSPAFARILTGSPLMFALFQAIERLAPSPLPVLIRGESGSGKELVARAIHDLSGRDGSFVAVNVAGLEGHLFADVLFGHARGAFTGADSVRSGLVKRAEGGTLFMDEIGDLGPEIQVKLLRFIQEGEYYPIGSDRPEHSTCRIVMATHVDLGEAVKAKRFRADLYYRLTVHTIGIPPLRDRREDIALLANHFAREAASHLKLPVPLLPAAFLSVLHGYDYPGNIRELSAMVHGAMAEGVNGQPSVNYIKEYIASHRAALLDQQPESCPDYRYEIDGRFPTLEALERLHIQEALRRSAGNQTVAAALLGISQSTISRKLKPPSP